MIGICRCSNNRNLLNNFIPKTTVKQHNHHNHPFFPSPSEILSLCLVCSVLSSRKSVWEFEIVIASSRAIHRTLLDFIRLMWCVRVLLMPSHTFQNSSNKTGFSYCSDVKSARQVHERLLCIITWFSLNRLKKVEASFYSSLSVPGRQNVWEIIMERKWILSDKLYVAEKLREMTGARRDDVFLFSTTTAP